MQLAARIFVALLLAGLMLCAATPAAQAQSSPAAQAGASSACNGASTVPTIANIGRVEHSTLCLINVQRRSHGLGRLRSNRLLRRAALSHSREMVASRYFGHRSRDGSNFVARIREAGYLLRTRYWRAGENLAWGVGADSTPGAVVRAWMNSPPHRHNILTQGFQSVGLGIIPGSPRSRDRGATYTTDFGYRTR